MYSQINAGSYPLIFQPTLPSQIVPALTTKATFLFENAELGYKVTTEMMPFINAGLIQVVQYSNSRPIIANPINGSLPQLNMNQNGFRLGGGVSFNHKQFTLRLEQKYYNAGGTFTSNQTFVGLEYQFS